MYEFYDITDECSTLSIICFSFILLINKESKAQGQNTDKPSLCSYNFFQLVNVHSRRGIILIVCKHVIKFKDCVFFLNKNQLLIDFFRYIQLFNRVIVYILWILYGYKAYKSFVHTLFFEQACIIWINILLKTFINHVCFVCVC